MSEQETAKVWETRDLWAGWSRRLLEPYEEVAKSLPSSLGSHLLLVAEIIDFSVIAVKPSLRSPGPVIGAWYCLLSCKGSKRHSTQQADDEPLKPRISCDTDSAGFSDKTVSLRTSRPGEHGNASRRGSERAVAIVKGKGCTSVNEGRPEFLEALLDCSYHDACE